MSTVREFVDMLVSSAQHLPAGLDSEVELGICDGTNLTIVENVDISDWTHVRSSDGKPTDRGTYLMVRGHLHPDDEPTTMRAETATLDDELRQLTENEQDDS